MKFHPNKVRSIEVAEIRPVGQGDRVCVDMMSNFKPGHSLLVGSYNRALFLIHCETLPNEFVATRPARVNAGPVSMYVMCEDFSTKYLNELKPGDQLLTTDYKGNTSTNTVARSKIEPRPMLLIKGKHELSGSDIFKLFEESEDYFNGYRSIFHLQDRQTKNPINVLDIENHRERKGNICAELDVAVVLQDAETVPVILEDGTPKSVKQLQCGDRIKAYVQNPKLQSRHFGMAYEGFCLER